jgi:hypothetical protein
MVESRETLHATGWREALRVVPTSEEYNATEEERALIMPKEIIGRAYPQPEGIDYRKELLNKEADHDFCLSHLGQMTVNKLGNMVYVMPEDDKDRSNFYRMMHLFNTGTHIPKSDNEEVTTKQLVRARKIILLGFADALNINVDENNPDYDSIQRQTVDYFLQMAKEFDFPFPEIIVAENSEEHIMPVDRSFSYYMNQAKDWAENKVDEKTGKTYRELHPEPLDYFF